VTRIESIDKDEVEIWMRHPVTKLLVQNLKDEELMRRYRNATDVLELGRAQGFDEAVRLIGGFLGDPNRLFSSKGVRPS